MSPQQKQETTLLVDDDTITTNINDAETLNIEQNDKILNDALVMNSSSSCDRSHITSFIFEDPKSNGNVLTEDGVNKIAHHKYKAGDHTYLDGILNPFWMYCTQTFLPIWMAPNVVTTLGGAASALSYLVTWYYLPNFEQQQQLNNDELQEQQLPRSLYILNGLLVLISYTLDCMDGKQARRTNSSTPLGQLFDHGIDCCSNIAHISCIQCWLLLGPTWYSFWGLASLQITFYVTQWEEYHTGVLQHACNNFIGVTEVSYSLGLATILNGFIGDKSIYSTPMQDVLSFIFSPVFSLVGHASDEITNGKSPTGNSLLSQLTTAVLTLPFKYFFASVWITLNVYIILGCIHRVHIHFKKDNTKTLLATSKLLSPLAVAFVMITIVPTSVVFHEIRYLSLSVGFCFCFITIKLIVYSMARMSYASFQVDVIPLLLVLIFISYELNSNDRRLQPKGVKLLLQIMTMYYLVRLVLWTRIAIKQLCEKLNIHLFTIDYNNIKDA